MPACKRSTLRAFTLIELLVVVAIISMLMSMLLPSLTAAREQARAAKCGVQLQGLGRGIAAYASEFNDWIPGVNTSGVATRIAAETENEAALRRPHTPIQNFDWMSPVLRYETELGGNRAERLRTLLNDYQCPAQQGLTIDFLWPPGIYESPDADDFTPEIVDTYAPLSYLMPAHFQWWGLGYGDPDEGAGTLVALGRGADGQPVHVYARVAKGFFAAYHRGRYQSRIDKLGPPARKIAAADGMRYLNANDEIDIDISPDPDYFGCFASNGAWWCGSQAYGVKNGTTNWNGSVVDSGEPDLPAAQGRNMAWSYRHGTPNRARITENVHDNTGMINALFFDGHLARLDDRASREIDLWYPTGAVVQGDEGEETYFEQGLTDLPKGFVVP
jgi:prepilin-type N-terminal cleavage/methylation domain-containing protein/prepilin-type processing-associated H-X9-DG protein